MNETVLHYIYDPLCGWCYGAAPLVKVARQAMRVQPHAGGMMAGARRQPVTPSLRAFVAPHDRRIAQLSGQVFGEAYLNGLLGDTTAVFDSEPPIAAMLAAENLAQRGLDMLARLQVAHYVEGRRIADRAVLIEQAESLGLDPKDFSAALDVVHGRATQEHIVQTRELMARTGIQGFPGMVLERDGVMTPIDVGRFLGRAEEWGEWLRGLAPKVDTPAAPDAPGAAAGHRAAASSTPQ